MAKKSLEVQYFKILRQISQDLWNIRRKKEQVSVESLDLLAIHLSKLLKSLPCIRGEYSLEAKSLFFEVCAEILNLVKDFSYAPFFTRLIDSFSSSKDFSIKQIAVFFLTFFCFDIHSKAKTDKLRKDLDLKSITKLPNDQKTRSDLICLCYEMIKIKMKLSNDPNINNILNQILSNQYPNYLEKSPRELFQQSQRMLNNK
jgi:hypothetical protein